MEDGYATRPTDPFVVRKIFQDARSSADMAAFNAAVQLNKILLMAYRAWDIPFHRKLPTRSATSL
jgi:hypothetical protein